jgi:hypothetical protein
VSRRRPTPGSWWLTRRAVPGGGTYRAVTAALIGRLDSPAVTTSAAVRPYRAVLERLAFPRHPAPRDTAAPDQAVVLGEGVLRMLRALAAEGTGCLLRLEGLHRADADTLAVVEYLAGSAADAPVLVTVSVRPGTVADRLRAADGVRSLALRRLGPEDVAALAAACRAGDPDARALAIRSEGLPFVAEEMLAATLLEPDGPSLRWPHALTRDAVLAALLPPERAALAARAADALVARGDPADEPRAAVLSIEAGRPERAARTLLDLARRDAARGALRSAEKRLTQAADAAGDSRLGNEVLRERVSVLTLVGRAAEALEPGAARLGLVTGDAHAERAGSPEALCEALGVAGAPPCPGSPSPSPPSPTRTAGCGRPTGSVRGPPSSSGRTGSSPGATTGRPGDRATALAGAVGLSPGRGARAQAA